MAAGSSFTDYRSLRPSPSPSAVGRALGPMPDAFPSPDVDGDFDASGPEDAMMMEDGDGALAAEPMTRMRYGADDTPYDEDLEHGPSSSRAALAFAIQRGLSKTTPQTPQLRSPYNRLQLRQLGIPDTEIEVGAIHGLYEV